MLEIMEICLQAVLRLILKIGGQRFDIHLGIKLCLMITRVVPIIILNIMLLSLYAQISMGMNVNFQNAGTDRKVLLLPVIHQN